MRAGAHLAPAPVRGSGRRGRLARVALLELVDAARGVDDLLLARVEGVGLRRDLDLVARVLLAVLPLIVSLVETVERVTKPKSQLVSRNTTSR